MIKEFLTKHGEYSDQKSFSQMTTLRMGGEIAHYVEPYTAEDLKEIVYFLKNSRIPFKVIGNGSNMACGSSRFEGVVISMKKLNSYELHNNEVYAEAGVLAPYLAGILARNGLSGFEFAGGIPGTIGGLVYMNAGAYKKDMSTIVKEVTVLKKDEIVTMSSEEMEFAYRHSVLQEHPHWVVISCVLVMNNDDPENIMSLMADRLERRRNSQPLDKPSAGSCFRNPPGYFAWELIEKIGYRGKKIGGVMVSDKHPNFLVNDGGGKTEDYLKLALEIQDKVQEEYDVKLIMEVEKFNC